LSAFARPIERKHRHATRKTHESRPGNLPLPLGQVVATPGALDLLDRTATNAQDLLQRHQHGDWGSVPPDDAEANTESVVAGNRILSSYPLSSTEKLWDHHGVGSQRNHLAAAR
jgi:hypothetical protein